MDNKKIGIFIAACRKEKGMTQQQLADRLGITNKAVSKWETGSGLPDISMLEVLGEVLGVTADEILRGEKRPEKQIQKKKYPYFEQLIKKVCNPIMVTGLLLGAMALFLLGIQVWYQVWGKGFALSYLFDWMPNVIYMLVTCFLAASLILCVFWKRKWVKRLLIAAAGICILLQAIFAIYTAGQSKSMVEFSPGLKQVLVLKETADSGKVRVYRSRNILFVRPGDELPYTVSNKIKTQWLAEDVCAVTYEAQEDKQTHQYVATYGDRSDGISYYYVKTAISGTWNTSGNKVPECKVTVKAEGIEIQSEKFGKMFYENEDCLQFGTLALVLCKNGLPQWTLSLDKNGKIEDSGYLSDSSTISLCQVSMEKTASLELVRTQRGD